jgi:hypothetical protein
MQGTFTVNGHRVRTTSQRRFVAWIVNRESGEPVEIFKRSDDRSTIKAHVQRRGIWPKSFVVIIDTTTGEPI